MIRRVLAVWRHRNDTIDGYARYGGRLLPHLLAAARERSEPPSLGRRDREPPNPHPDRSCDQSCDITDAGHGYGCVWTAGPDAHPASPTVLLPAVLDADPGHRAAVDVREVTADSQPTPEVCPPRTEPVMMDAEWQGATEDWSPANEQTIRPPSAALPETRAMRLEADRLLHEELSDVEARLRAAYDRWWVEFLARLGIDEGDLTVVATFADAITLAGVIVLPAVAVDYSTGEYEVVTA